MEKSSKTLREAQNIAEGRFQILFRNIKWFFKGFVIEKHKFECRDLLFGVRGIFYKSNVTDKYVWGIKIDLVFLSLGFSTIIDKRFNISFIIPFRSDINYSIWYDSYFEKGKFYEQFKLPL